MYEKYGDEVVFMMINLTDGYNETVNGVKEFVLATRFVKGILISKIQFQNHYMNESVLFRTCLFFYKNLYNLSFDCRTLFPT